MGAPSATVPSINLELQKKTFHFLHQCRELIHCVIFGPENLLLLLLGLALLDQIDLVLQDEDVLQLHDLDGGQVLGGLRLRARLVSG